MEKEPGKRPGWGEMTGFVPAAQHHNASSNPSLSSAPLTGENPQQPVKAKKPTKQQSNTKNWKKSANSPSSDQTSLGLKVQKLHDVVNALQRIIRNSYSGTICLLTFIPKILSSLGIASEILKVLHLGS